MYSQADILTAMNEHLGDLSGTAYASDAEKIRWFNDAQAILGWYKLGEVAFAWNAGDKLYSFATPNAGVEEIIYPDASKERRWRPVTQGLALSDPDGASEAGTATVRVRAFWPNVDGSTSSGLPRIGDACCIAYALSRFYKKMVSNRSIYKRYATLVGANSVSIDDLAQAADDHYRDFLDLRAELPEMAPESFFS